MDWGLGHATRCIPVINELLRNGCEVQMASSGQALTLLREEFSSLKSFKLIPYSATYSSWLPLRLKVALQLPKFLYAIWKEHRQIKRIVSDEKIDFIISDNRYGCWSAQKPSVFIGHLLNVEVPLFQRMLNRYHSYLINRFSICWIPDTTENSLSGKLSAAKLKHVKYIGLLSRMKWKAAEIQYEIIAVISGPEPQRTIFEKKIRAQLLASKKKSLVVKGLPESPHRSQTDNLTEVSHLHSAELNEALLQSALVICRSGYSSVMDLATLGKKAIFVPTPGQPEQEYLADEMMKKGIAYAMPQHELDIAKAIDESKKITGFGIYQHTNNLREAVRELIDLQERKENTETKN
ncbi:MAG: glycosyltransferase [Bacteroidetes bacterium]|nr:glycosyltransferase [Bacteroidota bacterium]MBS1541609.1 glycosyltransferase [Bacteroidota bacterium]